MNESTKQGVTLYSGISKHYFMRLLNTIIELGGLECPGLRVLDFGCGNNVLKRMLPDVDITGYDIIPELSDVGDWRDVDFDLFVSNQVFYCFEPAALESLLQELRSLKPDVKLVIGVSRQGFLNNIGKYLFGRKDAHAMARMRPEVEMDIFRHYCNVQRSVNVFFLADVYALTFKED